MIHLITGGQRSGKSSYAQRLALDNSNNPVYLATAKIWDEDFSERVKRHKEDRSDQWTNIEMEINIDQSNRKGRVLVLDCITLWLTNIFMKNNMDVQKSLTEAKTIFDKFISEEFVCYVVSNELGMSLHAETEAGRKFTDLQGWMNQYIAEKAEKVTLMVSGIPLKVK